jgi:hypothetical protein
MRALHFRFIERVVQYNIYYYKCKPRLSKMATSSELQFLDIDGSVLEGVRILLL